MGTLSNIAAFAIAACGFMTVVAMLIFTTLFAWDAAIRRLKNIRAMLLLTSRAMYGERYNRNLMLPALKEWIGDSDVAACTVIDFAKRLRPDAESAWDGYETEDGEQPEQARSGEGE